MPAALPVFVAVFKLPDLNSGRNVLLCLLLGSLAAIPQLATPKTVDPLILAANSEPKETPLG